ncbi:unnamed protein product, partial [Vitis vinifera]|uniref:DNA-directed RNA polymerase n=1 Tax=Vitis vinifera TaxID=29760 RepID=D7TA10_VITVI
MILTICFRKIFSYYCTHLIEPFLNRARDDAGSSAQKSLLESNNLKAMVRIGSKGSFISISQMTTCNPNYMFREHAEDLKTI